MTTYKNLESQFEKLFRHIKVGSFKTRKLISELLGHHRDDVTRIYLANGDADD